MHVEVMKWNPCLLGYVLLWLQDTSRAFELLQVSPIYIPLSLFHSMYRISEAS